MTTPAPQQQSKPKPAPKKPTAKPAATTAPAAKPAAPPPPATPQKQVSQPCQTCPQQVEKPCDVDTLTLKVDVDEDTSKKVVAKQIRRQEAVTDVKSKTILDLLAKYDLIIDHIAAYPCREDPYPSCMAKIEAETTYHGHHCSTQAHPLMLMKPEKSASGIIVKAEKIGPKAYHAEPINADFGLDGGGVGVILCIIKTLWPLAHPKLVEVRAESCGIRARGDGGQQRRNLSGLVRIFRKDTISLAIKLPPLGNYKHEREGTLTGERETKRTTESSAGFGYAKNKTESTTGQGGNYEYTETKWRGSSGSSNTYGQKTEGGQTTQTMTRQHSGSQGSKSVGVNGHFSTEVMEELQKQGPIALVLKRNDREFEKELLGGGPHKSLKEMVLDGLIKGVELIAKGIETLNKAPQLGWKLTFSVSVFAGTIGLEWGPKHLPAALANGRYLGVGLKIVGKIAMDILSFEAALSFGVDAQALGTGVVAKVEAKASLKVSVETEIAIEEWKPKVEVALKPEAKFTGKAVGYASLAGFSLIDAQLTCSVAFTMNDGKLEIEANHGIVLKGTLKREAVYIKGYAKVPVWGREDIDPPILVYRGAVLHKFG